ncbi:MAG: hypothetical protein INR64_09345, partial [Caulobacteraceae bacterium]|nr:hypothetical protein [Caulobacter sp.]
TFLTSPLAGQGHTVRTDLLGPLYGAYAAIVERVADPRLRAIAPAAPERHARIDSWPELAAAIEAALFPGG